MDDHTFIWKAQRHRLPRANVEAVVWGAVWEGEPQQKKKNGTQKKSPKLQCLFSIFLGSQALITLFFFGSWEPLLFKITAVGTLLFLRWEMGMMGVVLKVRVSQNSDGDYRYC